MKLIINFIDEKNVSKEEIENTIKEIGSLIAQGKTTGIKVPTNVLTWELKKR